MYWHASQTAGIKVLEPRISNHGTPLVYFSLKRENVLVYLSNAIEKFCVETGFDYDGAWTKWGSYGFDRDGILILEEYYPDAFAETYSGVSGYIYFAEKLTSVQDNIGISNAVTTSESTPVDGFVFIADAYNEILKAVGEGKIKLIKYEQHTQQKLEWIRNTMINEYASHDIKPDYRYFIENKFPFAIK